MKIRTLLVAGFLALGLAGCATTDQRQATTDRDNSRNYVAYGVVETIQHNNAAATTGVGAGAVIGGVVGGVLGNQIGSGSGKTAATVAGVAGGALIGHQIDKNRQATAPYYTVGVRLNNGDYQTTNLDSIGDLRIGDRVRVENNQMYRY